jgi:hypothetical protein
MFVFGVLCIALIAAAAVIPSRLGPVMRGWTALANVISKVTTPVFMGLVFFVVITPAGLLMRLFGRNPIRHRAVNESYWASRSEARGSMMNQF